MFFFYYLNDLLNKVQDKKTAVRDKARWASEMRMSITYLQKSIPTRN